MTRQHIQEQSVKKMTQANKSKIISINSWKILTISLDGYKRDSAKLSYRRFRIAVNVNSYFVVVLKWLLFYNGNCLIY